MKRFLSNIFNFFWFLAITRVQGQISATDATNPQFVSTTDQQSSLQVSANQELSPTISPSPTTRQFLGLKSPTFPQVQTLRTQTPVPSPHEYQQSPATTDNGDIYQPPATPKPTFQPRLPSDPFAQQPATPRPQFGVNRPTLQV